MSNMYMGPISYHPVIPVRIEIQGNITGVKGGVVPKLPYPVLIGRDFPGFGNLLLPEGRERVEDPELKESSLTESHPPFFIEISQDLFPVLKTGRKTKRERKVAKVLGNQILLQGQNVALVGRRARETEGESPKGEEKAEAGPNPNTTELTEGHCLHLLCPGIVFADFFIMNLILWVKGSSAAIPFGTPVAILAMWFGISVPLTFIGAYFGFKEKPIEHPVRTNQIPRQIPEQSFFTKPLPGIIMGGILPFGCIYIQLFFILNSIWSHQMYYMFGFLFLVFIILLITCSETTVLLCYFHLCAEDYHWWWRSFLTSSFTAVYLFIYAVHYFFSKLQITGTASTIFYFGYTMIMVLIFFLFTGTIGFFACFWFVSKMG
nr:LOW QUALITY PROTEIN: transmembrane 9 superfamily member 2-like [Caretta caretta]